MVGGAADVDGAPLAFEILGAGYVAWRDARGAIVATHDRCPHREAPLSRGTAADGCLRCPYHGWTFGESGRCIEIPSSGPEATIAPAAHLQTLPIEQRYGLLWFCPGTPRHPIPELAVDDDPAFTRLNTAVQVWGAAATRMVDNMLDVAHFPFTHAGTFGREQETEVPAFTVTELDDTFTGYRYEVVVNNEGEAKAMSGGGEDVITLSMTTGFALPYSVRSTMSYDNGIEQVLFMTASPISHERSYYTFVLWRNDDVSETGAAIVDFELAVTDEDRGMLEQIPGPLTLDHGALCDVQSDRASVEWRRQYRRLVDHSP